MQFGNVMIEQVHGGWVVSTEIRVLRDDGSQAGSRIDKYVVIEVSKILDIINGFYWHNPVDAPTEPAEPE